MSLTYCLIHETRKATAWLNVPCAPGGKLPVCEECARPENRGAVFEKYRQDHEKTIKAFKQTNPGS
jgi:hypothetical protein